MKDRKQIIADGEKRWPEIFKIVQPNLIIPHLGKWCQNTEPDANGMEEKMKAELLRYLREKLATVPKEELVDACAETMSVHILDHLKTMADERSGGIQGRN